MKYETRLMWVLTITFGFVFLDRNAANFLMPFIADDFISTINKSDSWLLRCPLPGPSRRFWAARIPIARGTARACC